MTARTWIVLGGVLNGLLLVFHMLFWEVFDWPGNLQSLSYHNRNIIQVLNIHLILVFGLFTYVSLFRSSELLLSGLGRVLAFAIGLFWVVRVVNQALFWNMSHGLSQVLVVIFMGMGAMYLLPLFWTRGGAHSRKA